MFVSGRMVHKCSTMAEQNACGSCSHLYALILLRNLCLYPEMSGMRAAAAASGASGSPLWWGVMWRVTYPASTAAVLSSCCSRDWRDISRIVVCAWVEGARLWRV